MCISLLQIGQLRQLAITLFKCPHVVFAQGQELIPKTRTIEEPVPIKDLFHIKFAFVFSADDHLVEEFSFFWKIFHQFILGHPDIILTLSDAKFGRPNYLCLEKELLKGCDVW